MPLSFANYRIERQESAGLPDSWENVPWHKLSEHDSLELLGASDDFDIDVIQEAERSPLFTMPLPALKKGTWDERVSHPRLTDNRLHIESETPANANGGAAEKNETARYVLFRSFDFGVQNERAYRYRVKFGFNSPVKSAGRPEIKHSKYESPWSEPSSVVFVGFGGE